MKTVLFVCVGNSGRSLMAEALFNHQAPLGWRAVSAGTDPKPQANPHAIAVLREIGAAVDKLKPKPPTQEMIESAHRIITMGCGSDFCPVNFLPRIEDWGIKDPAGKSIDQVREIRQAIEKKVTQLIQQLDR